MSNPANRVQGGADRFEQDGAASNSKLLVECRRTLVRHRRLILMWAAAGVIAGILLQLPIQPIYRAVVTIEVQSPARAMDSARTTTSIGNLETKMKLLKSDETIARVEEWLIDDSYATPVEKRDWLSRLRRTLHIGGKQVIPLSSLIDQSARSVRAWRPGSTQLIEASCDSWSPAFAAKYCNLLTGVIQREDVESRGAMAAQTSDLLIRQAATIEAKLRDDQRRLEELTGQDHRASPRNDTSADRDRLRQLEGEVVKAQAYRMTKQAQIEAAQKAGAEITPEIVDSAAYATSQTRLMEFQRRLKVMSTRASAHDEKLLRLRSEITRIEAGLSEQRTTGMQRLQAEYEAAKHREDLLSLSYQALEAKQSPDFLQDSQADQLRREVAHDRQLYQAFLERAREAGFSSATQTSFVRVVEQARNPQSAIYPHRLPLVAAGLAIGSLAGLGLAFFRDSKRSVLRLPGESKMLLGVEELGVIPTPMKDPFLPRRHAPAFARSKAGSQSAPLRTAHWDEEFSLVAEAYRNAMLSIMLAKPKGEGRVYVVSSPGAGEGKSTVTTNLGVALSKSNLRAVLIDGDLRRPSLHRILSVPNGLGLRNILRGEVNLPDSSLYCKSTIFPNLCVIPAGAGRGQAAELLHTRRFGALVKRLLRDFDIILVDTPPVLHISDARVLAQNTNGAILVLRSGVTCREDAISVSEVFKQDHVPILGTILNDFNPANEGKYGYYKSYYAYQQQHDPEDSLATNS